MQLEQRLGMPAHLVQHHHPLDVQHPELVPSRAAATRVPPPARRCRSPAECEHPRQRRHARPVRRCREPLRDRNASRVCFVASRDVIELVRGRRRDQRDVTRRAARCRRLQSVERARCERQDPPRVGLDDRAPLRDLDRSRERVNGAVVMRLRSRRDFGYGRTSRSPSLARPALDPARRRPRRRAQRRRRRRCDVDADCRSRSRSRAATSGAAKLVPDQSAQPAELLGLPIALVVRILVAADVHRIEVVAATRRR